MINRIVLIFLSLLIASFSKAQSNSQDTTFFDEHWKNSGRADASYFRLTSSADGRLFLVKDYYIGGQLQMEGAMSSFNPDVRQGNFIFYDKSGGIESKESYLNNRLTGTTQVFHKGILVTERTWLADSGCFILSAYDTVTGTLRRRGIMRYGLREGNWVTYAGNGKLWLSLDFHNSILEGCRQVFDTISGVIQKEGTFVNDGLVDLAYYDSGGKLRRLVSVRNGKMEGFARQYDTVTGNLFYMLEYKNDSANGNSIRYCRSCDYVKSTGSVKNGVLDGEVRFYYDCSNKLYSIIQYKDGERDGSYVAFDKNTGNKIIEGQYVNGDLEGEWKYYFPEDGLNLRCIKHFKEGKLDGELTSWWRNKKQRRKELYKMGTLDTWNCYTEDGRDTIYYPFHTAATFLKNPPQSCLNKWIEYPQAAMKDAISGKVLLEIGIEADTRISEATVISSTNPIFDEEALRVAYLLPVISPVLEDGTPCYSTMKIPLDFEPPITSPRL